MIEGTKRLWYASLTIIDVSQVIAFDNFAIFSQIPFRQFSRLGLGQTGDKKYSEQSFAVEASETESWSQGCGDRRDNAQSDKQGRELSKQDSGNALCFVSKGGDMGLMLEISLLKLEVLIFSDPGRVALAADSTRVYRRSGSK